MEFIQSILSHDEAVAVSTVPTYDLPVNPLSHILITLKYDQNLANDIGGFVNILAMMSRVEVLYKGSAVFSMSGLDAYACGLFICNFESWTANNSGDDNAELSITFLVPLTRTLYSPRECFPATTRGELILQITYAAAFTNIDDARAQIETVELVGATPEQFLKMTTKAVTPTATGQLDIELPIGNDISDLVLWGTTKPVDDSDTVTINLMEILVDNINHFYPESNFETIHNMAGQMRTVPGYHGFHTHRLLEAAYAQWDDTSAVIAEHHVLAHHLWMPFDIFRDGMFTLHTRGASDVVLRVDAGDTNPIRCIPCEVVKSAGSV